MMVLVRRLAPLLLALAAMLLAVPAAHAVPTMSIHDPITDNYKASYNADPSVRERRTWLAWNHLVAGGTTWTPASRDELIVSSVAVAGADGRSGTLSISRAGGTYDALSMRVDALDADSGGRWGPLLTVGTARPFAPLAFDLTLHVDGVVLASGRVRYAWDRTLAAVAPGHIEYNGPSGRWLVGARRTRTDQETVPSTLPTILAAFPPRITSLRVPLTTSSRSIIVRLITRPGTARVRLARISIAGRAFSRWVPIASAYRVMLPAGTAYRSVRLQVRDSLGLVSTVVSRRVRCSCG